MDRMIRCIEGHVFDAGKHARCPECGWVPDKAAKKSKRREEGSMSLGEMAGAVFAALTGFVDRLLGATGIKAKPHASAAIVYAAMILFCVGAVAYPGSPLWPGNWGSAKIADDKGKPPDASSKDKQEPSPFGPGNNSQTSVTPGPSPTPAPVPAPAPAPGPIAPTRIVVGGGGTGHGAIAYDPKTKYWGEAFGFRNQNAAAQRALKECSGGAPNCVVGVSFYRSCGAISAAGNGAWGPGMGPTPQLAILDSMVACKRNNGDNCELQRVACTR